MTAHAVVLACRQGGAPKPNPYRLTKVVPLLRLLLLFCMSDIYVHELHDIPGHISIARQRQQQQQQHTPQRSRSRSSCRETHRNPGGEQVVQSIVNAALRHQQEPDRMLHAPEHK